MSLYRGSVIRESGASLCITFDLLSAHILWQSAPLVFVISLHYISRGSLILRHAISFYSGTYNLNDFGILKTKQCFSFGGVVVFLCIRSAHRTLIFAYSHCRSTPPSTLSVVLFATCLLVSLERFVWHVITYCRTSHFLSSVTFSFCVRTFSEKIVRSSVPNQIFGCLVGGFSTDTTTLLVASGTASGLLCTAVWLLTIWWPSLRVLWFMDLGRRLPDVWFHSHCRESVANFVSVHIFISCSLSYVCLYLEQPVEPSSTGSCMDCRC